MDNPLPEEPLDFANPAVQAGWLESMVLWAVHPARPRDADYRLAELAERWTDYQRRTSGGL